MLRELFSSRKARNISKLRATFPPISHPPWDIGNRALRLDCTYNFTSASASKTQQVRSIQQFLTEPCPRKIRAFFTMGSNSSKPADPVVPSVPVEAPTSSGSACPVKHTKDNISASTASACPIPHRKKEVENKAATDSACPVKHGDGQAYKNPSVFNVRLSAAFCIHTNISHSTALSLIAGVQHEDRSY